MRAAVGGPDVFLFSSLLRRCQVKRASGCNENPTEKVL